MNSVTRPSRHRPHPNQLPIPWAVPAGYWPAPPKTRARRCPSRYLYVRRCGEKRAWQARVHVGPRKDTPAVNLGYFSEAEYGSLEAAEWAAGRAAREFSRRCRPGRDPWEVVEELRGLGYVPANVLPRYVYRRPDGLFGARRGFGSAAHLPGPFASAKEAHDAMAALVAATLPRKPPRRSPD